MLFNKSFYKTFLMGLALTALATGVIDTVVQAQGTPGLVIFGNRDVDILNYYLDFGGIADNRDRYRFRIPKNKLPNGMSQLKISYPDYFDGKFDTDNIEVRPNGDKKKSLPLKSVVWDEKNRFLQIDLATPLQEAKKLEIVMSNTKNPEVGTYYFYGQVIPARNTPVPEKIGAWIVNINPH